MRSQYALSLPIIHDGEPTPDPLGDPSPTSPTPQFTNNNSHLSSQSILDALESITSPSNDSVDSFSTSAYLDLANALSNASQLPSLDSSLQHHYSVSDQSINPSNSVQNQYIHNLSSTTNVHKSQESIYNSTLGSPVSDITHPFAPTKDTTNDNLPSNQNIRLNYLSSQVKKSRTRKSRARHSNPPNPSRFCHICARTQKSEKVFCNNLLTERKCRKAVCEPCFKELKWDFRRAKEGGWICPHCCGACSGMPRARCHIYRKTNQRRKAGREQAAAVENIQTNHLININIDDDNIVNGIEQ